MKACQFCDDFNRSILHPYCNSFDAPIRMDADWHLNPVRECVAHEAHKATLGRFHVDQTRLSKLTARLHALLDGGKKPELGR